MFAYPGSIKWMPFVTISLNKLVFFLYRVKDILPINSAIQVYYSFIYSKKSIYAIEVFGTAI